MGYPPTTAENVTVPASPPPLCVGCGACAGLCPRGGLAMAWTASGEYRPEAQGECPPSCDLCRAVCPCLDHPEDEDSLAAAIFAGVPGIRHRPETGHYLVGYVGHAEGGYRARGASGGVASWFLASCLEQGVVDRVICVAPQPESACLFAFTVCDRPEQVRAAAGSAYYPLEMSAVLQAVQRDQHRYALIGLPCFVKALRLAMLNHRQLRERIVLLAGLVCGHLKSTGFAGFLARSLGLTEAEVAGITFRHPLPGKPATDYAVLVTGKNGRARLGRMAELAPGAWPEGLFKLQACSYCDDVFAELADVTFMDAWLPEYSQDGAGTSLALVRGERAHALLQQGMAEGQLSLQPIGIEQAVASQAGILAQKRSLLAGRLWLADRQGDYRPRKRVPAQRPGMRERLGLQADELLRVASHQAMRAQREAGEGLTVYAAAMARARRRANLLRRLAGRAGRR